jgi:hypothetical protein
MKQLKFIRSLLNTQSKKMKKENFAQNVSNEEKSKAHGWLD